MILKEATIKYANIDPDKLSKGSHKRICRSCDKCGRIDWVDNSAQHFSACRFCSHVNENNGMYGVSRYGKNSPHYKNGMSLIDMKSWVIDYKGRKCEKCGLVSNINQIYEFHHINPEEKLFNISSFKKYSKKYNIDWDVLKNELDKCIIVCANCHRIIHYGDK